MDFLAAGAPALTHQVWIVVVEDQSGRVCLGTGPTSEEAREQTAETLRNQGLPALQLGAGGCHG